VLPRVVIDEAMEMGCQRAGNLGRSPGARALDPTLGALGGKAMHPFPQGRIRQLQRVGDVLDAPSFHDVAPSLGPAEEARFFCLFQEGVP
jgi:hypothetical protein